MTEANAINAATTGIVGNTGTSFTATAATQYAVIVGGSTSSTLTNIGPSATALQVLQSGGGSANPSYSTATYPSSTTINQLLYSSAANTVAGITVGNNGVLITSASGVPSWLGAGTTGQVLTATTSNPPSWQSPANFIFAWTDESTTFTPAIGNGYFVTGNATAVLPTAAQGNTIAFTIDAATTTLTITGNTGQTIRLGSAVSASAGTCVNNARGDSITLVYRSSDTSWIASQSIGTWTIT